MLLLLLLDKQLLLALPLEVVLLEEFEEVPQPEEGLHLAQLEDGDLLVRAACPHGGCHLATEGTAGVHLEGALEMLLRLRVMTRFSTRSCSLGGCCLRLLFEEKAEELVNDFLVQLDRTRHR